MSCFDAAVRATDRVWTPNLEKQPRTATVALTPSRSYRLQPPSSLNCPRRAASYQSALYSGRQIHSLCGK